MDEIAGGFVRLTAVELHANVDVSVIIISWNTRELLRDCLKSIQQSNTVRIEIIVVDNHSSDGSPEMVAQEFPDVRALCNSENRGFAAANNQAMTLARGRYVLLLNSDTRILDDAIAKSVSFADNHPEAAVVGCRIVWPDGSLQHTCMMFPSLMNLCISLSQLARLFPRNRFFGRQRLTWWDYRSPRVVDAVAGCFMLVRAEAVKQVGGLAEEYFMYSEDVEWCWRFGLRGWKTMYTPEGLVVHIGGASASQSAINTHVMLRQSLLAFLEKKSGAWTRRVANLMFSVASLFRLPLLMLARAKGGETAEAARLQWQLSIAALRFHVLGEVPRRPGMPEV